MNEVAKVETFALVAKGSRQFIVFCRKCGIVGTFSRLCDVPYSFECPECGTKSKLFHQRHMKNYPTAWIRKFVVSNVHSEAGQKLLKQDLLLKQSKVRA